MLGKRTRWDVERTCQWNPGLGGAIVLSQSASTHLSPDYNYVCPSRRGVTVCHRHWKVESIVLNANGAGHFGLFSYSIICRQRSEFNVLLQYTGFARVRGLHSSAIGPNFSNYWSSHSKKICDETEFILKNRNVLKAPCLLKSDKFLA